MQALNLIGFTGTIASGKSVRCRHLLNYAATKYDLNRMNCTSAGKCSNIEWTELFHKKIKDEYLPIKCTNMSILHINADKVAHHIYAPGETCYYELIQTFGDRILCKKEPLQQLHKCKSQETNFSTSLRKDAHKNKHNKECGNVEQELQCLHPLIEEIKPRKEAELKAMPKIDRRILSEIVFADQSALETLNRICRPAIAHKVQQMMIDAYCTTLQHSIKKLFSAEESCWEQPYRKWKKDEEAIALIVLLEAALLIEAENFVSACNEVWITHCDREEAITRVMQRNYLSYNEAKRRLQSQLDLEGKVARLHNLHYDKPVRLMNTSNINTTEGLRHAEELFDEFWKINVAPHFAGH